MSMTVRNADVFYCSLRCVVCFLPLPLRAPVSASPTSSCASPFPRSPLQVAPENQSLAGKIWSEIKDFKDRHMKDGDDMGDGA